MTVPLTGETSSIAALADSILPKGSSLSTEELSSGRSSEMISPSFSWAWSVIPMVARLPSTLIQMCS